MLYGAGTGGGMRLSDQGGIKFITRAAAKCSALFFLGGGGILDL